MLSDLVVPGELPPTAAAWRAQQARWTKGHAQCARKLLPMVWNSTLPFWKKTAMTLQMCQFAFYTLAFTSAAISLFMMSVGLPPYPAVAILGLIVTFLGLSCSVGYLWLGQRMLGQEHDKKLYRALVLAVVFPSGLILANTRATFEAFFSTRMDFTPHPARRRNPCRRLARRARTDGRHFRRRRRLGGIRQLERIVLCLRRLRPGFHRRHGRGFGHGRSRCASALRRASEPS